jgi:hypothetical protein
MHDMKQLSDFDLIVAMISYERDSSSLSWWQHDLVHDERVLLNVPENVATGDVTANLSIIKMTSS